MKYQDQELYEALDKINAYSAQQEHEKLINASETILEGFDLDKIQRKTEHIPYFFNSYLYALFCVKAYEKGSGFADTIAEHDCRRHPYICHNAACHYVFNNEPDKAMKQVTMAYDYNYDLLQDMFNDEDLAPLFARPDFKELKSKFEAEASKYLGQPPQALLAAALGFMEMGSEAFPSEAEDVAKLSDLLAVIEKSDIGFTRETKPLALKPGWEETVATLQSEMDDMAQILGRLAKKGKNLFAKNPDHIFNHVTCCAANGGIYPDFCDTHNLEERASILNVSHHAHQNAEDVFNTLDPFPNIQALIMRSMGMDETGLEKLPVQLLQQLRYLDLSDNDLFELPDQILELPNLEWLDLRANNLSVIPEKLKQNKGLRYLNLKENCLVDNDCYLLEKDLLGCKIAWGDSKPLIDKRERAKLEAHYVGQSKEALLYAASSFLNIGSQAFASETGDFNLLTKLVDDLQKADIGFSKNFYPIELDFSDEETERGFQPLFDQLAGVLDRLAQKGQFLFKDKLEDLFKHIKCSVPNGGVYAGFYDVSAPKENIYIVHFGDLPYQDFEDEIKMMNQYPNLQALILFSTGMNEYDMDELPIQEMKNLRLLDLSDNEFNDIPDEVLELPNLEWLSLSGNNLTDIPEKIKKMKNLRYLRLSDNYISANDILTLMVELKTCKIV